ncbi:MAG: hypothetical protein D3908_11740 [Candidatus Electrothrix sp. AUS4]|nr:hypothetical protein [Candidatus Electrothrix sp. AUS4]
MYYNPPFTPKNAKKRLGRNNTLKSKQKNTPILINASTFNKKTFFLNIHDQIKRFGAKKLFLLTGQ